MKRAVGSNVRRKDGDAKVTGAAMYIDDVSFPGMLFGATVRSTIPRGEIVARHIDLPLASWLPIIATFQARTTWR